MAQGLQVWDSDGKLQLDSSSKTSKMIGKLEAYTANKTYTFTDARFSTGKPFYIIAPVSSPYSSSHITVTITGNTATIKTSPVPNGATFSSWQFIVYMGIY